jgi:hypothetical protein
MDYIIRKKNYSLWRYCKNKFDIIKINMEHMENIMIL